MKSPQKRSPRVRRKLRARQRGEQNATEEKQSSHLEELSMQYAERERRCAKDEGKTGERERAREKKPRCEDRSDPSGEDLSLRARQLCSLSRLDKLYFPPSNTLPLLLDFRPAPAPPQPRAVLFPPSPFDSLPFDFRRLSRFNLRLTELCSFVDRPRPHLRHSR